MNIKKHSPSWSVIDYENYLLLNKLEKLMTYEYTILHKYSHCKLYLPCK